VATYKRGREEGEEGRRAVEVEGGPPSLPHISFFFSASKERNPEVVIRSYLVLYVGGWCGVERPDHPYIVIFWMAAPLPAIPIPSERELGGRQGHGSKAVLPARKHLLAEEGTCLTSLFLHVSYHST